jgi:2,7-dihydroxy-5-methyl-1-naphthoate 7-O-methyltransferase
MSDHAAARLQELAGMLTPMAIRVAATLRLADLIDEGVTSPDELARRCDAEAGALGQLLRYLVAISVFTEPEPDRFGLGELGRALLDDHPAGMRGWLDLNGLRGRWSLACTGLLEAVRTGRSSYASTHGVSFWEDITGDPAHNVEYHEMINDDRHTGRLAQFVSAYDWSGVRHVVDVGGGNGWLLKQLLRAEPNLRGTLVDLPERLAGVDAGDRLELAPGSFFDPLPAGADVYVLSQVLVDWGDAEAVAILRGCREAAGAAGRVVVADTQFDDLRSPGASSASLATLLLVGGRTRTRGDLLELAAAAGLEQRTADDFYTEFVTAPSSRSRA